MSLEIKHGKTSDEFHKMTINSMFTGSWLHSVNTVRQRPCGVTLEQYNELRILRGSYPKKMRLSRITKRMIDKGSNCTRLVKKLRMKADR